MSAVDPELERHRRAWIGFARLIRYSLAAIIILLIGLALLTL
jgi:hypothetical protein